MKKLILFLIFSLFIFVPPYERDELLYHLAVSKFFFLKDFSSPDFSHFFYYPWLTYFYNYISIYFNNVILAHLFHYLFFVFTLYLIYKYSGNHIIGVGLTLLFFTIQPSLRFSYVAYADFYLTFFSFGSLIMAIKAFDINNDKDHSRLNFLLSAVFCGLGLNIKYNMLVFALLLYFFIFWLSYTRFNRVKRAFRDSFVYFFISFAMFFPFLLKTIYLLEVPCTHSLQIFFLPPIPLPLRMSLILPLESFFIMKIYFKYSLRQ